MCFRLSDLEPSDFVIGNEGMKRKADDEFQSIRKVNRPAKRLRCTGGCHLFDLSDELLLHVLAYLPIASLLRCERVCKRLSILSSDDGLWRQKYYDHFIRSRARRIPSLTTPLRSSTDAIQERRWLQKLRADEEFSSTSWKKNYRVKSNWTTGRARAREVVISEEPRSLIIAKLYKQRLYVVDLQNGLQVWKEGVCVLKHKLDSETAPTSLCVDQGQQGQILVVIGFVDGTLHLYTVSQQSGLKFSTSWQGGARISAIATLYPHIMVLSASRTIHLIQVCLPVNAAEDNRSSVDLATLTALQSEVELSPASLSLRRNKSVLVAGVAYSFNRFNTGWCLGIQEIRMDLQGHLLRNRTTTSVGRPMQETFQPQSFTSRSASTSPLSLHPQFQRAPNSLSYCGCYIVAALPDNTLMVYTVTSTEDKLEINAGRRLWGHTSAVVAAEVTQTGKAISISGRSDEMRYWEFEDILGSSSRHKGSTPILPLKGLEKVLALRGDGLGLAIKDIKEEVTMQRTAVSFDDEQAIVLGRREHRQVISCFDFG